MIPSSNSLGTNLNVNKQGEQILMGEIVKINLKKENTIYRIIKKLVHVVTANKINHTLKRVP